MLKQKKSQNNKSIKTVQYIKSLPEHIKTKILSEIQLLWPNDKKVLTERLKLIHMYVIPNINNIISHKFKNIKVSPDDIAFIGMGGANIILSIKNKLFRIAYHQPKEEYKEDSIKEFKLLNSHDFGICAPVAMNFETDKYWWYEVKKQYPYQGATIQQYSRLFHKVFDLHKYGLYWFDVHDGNIMQTKDGELIIVDFDTGSIDYWMKTYMNKNFKNITLDEIKPFLNKYCYYRDLRMKIFMYLKLPITNKNWMKFCFGEYVYRLKYNIHDCYPTSLLNEQIKHKGNIGF